MQYDICPLDTINGGDRTCALCRRTAETVYAGVCILRKESANILLNEFGDLVFNDLSLVKKKHNMYAKKRTIICDYFAFNFFLQIHSKQYLL